MNIDFSRRHFMHAAGCLPALVPLLLLRSAAAKDGQALLKFETEYALPGRGTRWDYMSLDLSRERIFLAHMGDSAVVAVDIGTGRTLGVVEGIERVRGVEAIPDLGRVYATASATNEVVAIDADTYSVIARAKTGLHPDGLAYAPEVRKLYVSDEDGNSCSVIDVNTNHRVAVIPLGGSVGNTRYDPASRHIFVNVQGTGELVEIDPATDAVLRRMQLASGKGNHGLLIEPNFRLAFIGNEENDSLVVMDLRNAKMLAGFKASGKPDVLSYDAVLGILYLATESGSVHVYRVGAKGVHKLGDQQVGSNAHVVVVNPVTHRIYFPLRSGDHKRSVLRVMRLAEPR